MSPILSGVRATNALFGFLVAVAMVGSAEVKDPGTALGVAQTLGDGYVVSLFLGLMFFVRPPAAAP